MATPKTNRELDLYGASEIKKLMGYQDKNRASLTSYVVDINKFKEGLKYVKDTIKAEEKQLRIYKSLEVFLKQRYSRGKDQLSLLQKELEATQEIVDLRQKQTKAQRLGNAALSDGNRLLKQAIENNEKLFNIAHEMQLESNVTWKNYSKLYNEAYESTRKANREIGQSIHNVKDLVETQNRLLGAGWKDIDPRTLTEVSVAMMTLGKTLGKLDERLVNAFEQSFRIYGEATTSFVTNIGNSLNAFSGTFGVQIGILQGAVVDMIDSNNFIHRSNMQANMKANESLIKAAALSGAIGLTSTTFLTNLAKTSQFGTMEQMAQIYQGGALLQGFDTAKFQEQMIATDYEGATKQLLSSISGTLNSIDDHYLRAEYMSRIGSSFGLSQEELARIATHGDNLGEYSQSLQEKLLGINTSMEDELRDLRVNLVDRIQNAVQNFWGSQAIGSAMQELGLYGLSGLVRSIIGQVGHIIYQNSIANGGKLAGIGKSLGLGGGTTGTATGKSTGILGLSGKQIGGLGLGIAGNMAGRAIQSAPGVTAAGSILGGGLLNIGTGIAGGAMVGGIPGAIIGGTIGLVNTIIGEKERKSAQQELEDADRARRKANSTMSFIDYNTSDPVVVAIQDLKVSLINEIAGNHEENKTFIVLGDTAKKVSTVSEWYG